MLVWMQNPQNRPTIAWTAIVSVLVAALLFCAFASFGWFQGPQGPQGEPGVAGEQGPKGDQGDQGPPGPTPEVVVVQPTDEPEEEDEDPVVSEDAGTLRLGDGTYINWVDAQSSEFRQTDGTYLVPVSYLADKAPEAGVLVFEGEFWNTVGKHNVCLLVIADEDYPNSCPTKVVDGDVVLHVNQNSFWGFEVVTEGGDLPNDILMAFSHDKWMNWEEQEIVGNPIYAWLSDGTLNWGSGEEPVLTAVQTVMVSENAQDRCPANAPEIMETPYSDSSGGNAVVGAPGSFACRTLFVGYLTENGSMVAYYWRGARDGFSYWSEDSWFYLVPESWGENEIQEFVTEEHGDVDLSAK